MKNKQMEELLKALSETKVVRVTGSFADGTKTSGSDIDFYVKSDHPDSKIRGLERNMEKVLRVLSKFGINMESDIVGYIYSHKTENDLPIQIEFSDLFHPRKNRLPEVEILGVK